MNNTYVIANNEYPTTQLAIGLYVVATPIGNLGDITIRALQTLAGCGVIACEDTRTTRKLLQRYAINTPLMAYHEHNADKSAPKIVEHLKAGKSVALVSDAGTPLISDPGYKVVNLARDNGFDVVPIPGASSTLAALVASGLPTDTYTFLGFLPHKSGTRANKLESLAHHEATMVFFESPNRLLATLEAMKQKFGADRRISVCRELTKMHEEIAVGTVEDLLDNFSERTIKGEIVIVVEPRSQEAEQDREALLDELLDEMTVSKAAAEAARLTGLPKRELYQLALKLSQAK